MVRGLGDGNVAGEGRMPNPTEGDVTIDVGAFRRVTLAALDLPGVTAAFNTVCQRYVVPFAMDEEQMGRHLSSTALDLAHSPLWLDDQGEVAGRGCPGRARRAWLDRRLRHLAGLPRPRPRPDATRRNDGRRTRPGYAPS